MTTTPELGRLSPEQEFEQIRNQLLPIYKASLQNGTDPNVARADLLNRFQAMVAASMTPTGPQVISVPGAVVTYDQAKGLTPEQYKNAVEMQVGINKMAAELIDQKLGSEHLKVSEKFPTIASYLEHLKIDAEIPANSDAVIKPSLNKLALAGEEAKKWFTKFVATGASSAMTAVAASMLFGGPVAWGVVGVGFAASSITRLGFSLYRYVDQIRNGGTDQKLRALAAKNEIDRGREAIDAARQVEYLGAVYRANPSDENYKAYWGAADVMLSKVDRGDRAGDYTNEAAGDLAEHQRKSNKIEGWISAIAGAAGGLSYAFSGAMDTITGEAGKKVIESGHELVGSKALEGATQAGVQAKLELAKQGGQHFVPGHLFDHGAAGESVSRAMEFSHSHWNSILQSPEVAQGTVGEAAKYFHNVAGEVIKAGAINPNHATAVTEAGRMARDIWVTNHLAQQFGTEASKKAAEQLFNTEFIRLFTQVAASTIVGGVGGGFAGKAMIERRHRNEGRDEIAAIGRAVPSLRKRMEDEQVRVGVVPAAVLPVPGTPAAPVAPGNQPATPETTAEATGIAIEADDDFDVTPLGAKAGQKRIHVHGRTADGKGWIVEFYDEVEGGKVIPFDPKDPAKIRELPDQALQAFLKIGDKEARKILKNEQLPSEKSFLEDTDIAPLVTSLETARKEGGKIVFNKNIATAGWSEMNVGRAVAEQLKANVEYRVVGLHLDVQHPTVDLSFEENGKRTRLNGFRLNPLLNYVRKVESASESTSKVEEEKKKSVEEQVTENFKAHPGKKPLDGKFAPRQAYKFNDDLWVVHKIGKVDIELRKIQADPADQNKPLKVSNKFVLDTADEWDTVKKTELSEKYQEYLNTDN